MFLSAGIGHNVFIGDSNISAEGPGLKSATQTVETEFTINAQNDPGKHLNVRITGEHEEGLQGVGSNVCSQIIFQANPSPS